MASVAYAACFDSAEQFLNRDVDYSFLDVPVPPIVPTFRLRQFRSGEISAAYYLSGSPNKSKLPLRIGNVETSHLSRRAVTKIRRASQCTASPFCAFLTLTFNPSVALLDESGQVNHEYAKKEFIRFRQALSQRINRQIKCKLLELSEDQHAEYKEKMKFRYVWVAELQPGTKNIHFHVLINKYFPVSWLTNIWNQGKNALDVAKVNDSKHAAYYMTKYITKESTGRDKEPAIIRGNRYYISRQVSAESRPVMVLCKADKEAKECKDALKLFKKVIEDRGGIVIDSGFGVSIPQPSRSVTYRDKKTGTIKKTRGVSSLLHNAIICDFFPTPF